MWTQTTTHTQNVHLNGYAINPPTVSAPSAGRKIGRVSLVPEGAASIPEATGRSVSISGGQGFAVVAAIALGWVVLHGGTGAGPGGGKGERLVTDQQGMVFDNAVAQTKSAAFESAAPGYIDRYAPVAVAEMEKYGIPASISLAQGLLESRAGTSKLALATNNHFGLKCFSRGCKKGHCKNFTDDTHKDFFLNYNGGAWGSWRQHSLLLSQGRYQKLHGRDWKGWADGLQAVGYATDPNYAAALKGIIKRYELYHFDE